MEGEPQSSLTPTQMEMGLFVFRVRVAYYDRQQELEYTRIASTSRQQRNIRMLHELSVDRRIRDVCAKLENKQSIARDAAYRCREKDPDASISGEDIWASHHYDYLAAHILLENDKLDYEALNETLVEEGFDRDAVEEARESFEHFLLTEF